MNLKFFNNQGFKKIKSEREQQKEIFFIYGVCISRVALLDDFFITILKFNKYEFEGNQIGKKYNQKEIDKIETHYASKATMGMLINEFRETFKTDDFDDLFIELNRIRNLIVHSYMKLNWSQLESQALREEIYGDLLGVFEFLNMFEEKLKYKSFFTKKNSAFEIRWTGKSGDKK